MQGAQDVKTAKVGRMHCCTIVPFLQLPMTTNPHVPSIAGFMGSQSCVQICQHIVQPIAPPT